MDRFSSLRLVGVLPRIGVVYIITSLIFLKANIKAQAIIGVLLLLGYWAIMTLIPVPGFGAPNLNVPVLTNPTTEKFFLLTLPDGLIICCSEIICGRFPKFGIQKNFKHYPGNRDLSKRSNAWALAAN